jgi:hypothetical protein
MKKLALLLLILTSLCIGIVACGNDDGDDGDDSDDSDGSNGGSIKVDLGIDESKVVSDLTAEETTAACKAIMGAETQISNTMTDFSCAIAGLTVAFITLGIDGDTVADSDLVTACNEAKTVCTKDMVSEPIDATAECATASDDMPTNCDVTVGELEGCFNATMNAAVLQANAALALMPSCDDLTATSLEKLAEMNEQQPAAVQPAECDVVYEKCPELAAEMFSSDSSEMGM